MFSVMSYWKGSILYVNVECGVRIAECGMEKNGTAERK